MVPFTWYSRKVKTIETEIDWSLLANGLWVKERDGLQRGIRELSGGAENIPHVNLGSEYTISMFVKFSKQYTYKGWILLHVNCMSIKLDFKKILKFYQREIINDILWLELHCPFREFSFRIFPPNERHLCILYRQEQMHWLTILLSLYVFDKLLARQEKH